MKMTIQTLSLSILVTALIIICSISASLQALAQDTHDAAANSPDTKPPLEVTAEESLEWLRNEQKIIARKNALAKQGDASIKAQTLMANYREGQTGGFEISELSAEGDVIIKTQESAAYGQKAIYDLDNSTAIMTGDNLKMVSPDQTVTAKDRFEYDVARGKMTAIGDAVATRPNKNGGTDRLRADTISAIFTQNENGERVLEMLEADGNVTITTPMETITGTHGTYNATTNMAELTGDITITRGQNVLQGNRATIDLNTQKSKIFGGGARNNGRVKAVFYPDDPSNDKQ